MTKRRTTDEQIELARQKKDQMIARLKQLESRKSEEDRKRRTKRLIHIGAEVEFVLGQSIEEEDLPKLRNFLMEQENRGRFFSKAMGTFKSPESQNDKIAP